jgi:uncharacterized protein
MVQWQALRCLLRTPASSGVRRFDYLVQAVKRAGPRKILYGSDGPWLHPGIELYKIRMLGLPRHAEALVLGGNAKRLIFRPRVSRRLHTIARAPRNHRHSDNRKRHPQLLHVP